MDNDYLFARKFMEVIDKLCKSYYIMPDMNLLSGNPIITMAYVTKHMDKKWCWKGLASNPSISIAYMDLHPEYPWNQDEYEFRKYGGEAEEPQIPSNLLDIKVMLSKLNSYRGDGDDDDEEKLFHDISQHPHLTLEMIEENLSQPWRFIPEVLFSNPLTFARKMNEK